ncbi:WXG100 family type VII secretion target [Lentzea sp. NPDC059081]|uniref:WXG100 family type VII secretion target n=1 Tax=Lentzea sp. NPDC059081 TaxID=3346719 RepID=UPI0036B3874C
MAGNQSTSTTTPGMLTAAGYLTDTKGVASKGMATVHDQLAALSATWTGEAHMAFDSAMQEWFKDCKFIIDRLEDMIQLMHGNRKTIMTGEQANVDQVSQLQFGPGLAGL